MGLTDVKCKHFFVFFCFAESNRYVFLEFGYFNVGLIYSLRMVRLLGKDTDMSITEKTALNSGKVFAVAAGLFGLL